jgi:SprB repeat/Calx-beta domain
MRPTTTRLLVTLVLALFGIGLLYSQSQPITLNATQARHFITPTETQQLITFEHLTVGETYQFTIPNGATLSGCTPTITAAGSGLPESYGTAGMSFVAQTTTVSFWVHYPCSWSPTNPPMHLVTLNCISCKSKVLNNAIPDEVLVVGGGDAEQLIQDVLIGGNCFDLAGMTLQGNGGTFSGGLTNIGFNTGVIISTGPITNAPGPNNADNASGGGGGPSDPDLATLAAGPLFDVSKLEFDFTPTQSPIVFEYVFASEEYCEYVNAGVSDVFGFFISGPGIPGGIQNLAVLPNGTPVAVDNVNHLVNTGFYVNNQPASSGNLCGQTASSLPATQEVQYDGFTRRFTATANVQVCQTYHMKLVVGDVGDGVWDSAVFLKDGSFDAGGNASVEWVVNGEIGATETYEGCGVVSLLFDRVGGNPNIPINIPFQILGTATAGLDYANIPPSITIPAGVDQVTLNVNIFADLITEGQETIIIRLLNPCSCAQPQQTLIINDLPVLVTQPDTVVICGTGTATLTATVEGGVPPYTYNWSNNGGTNEQALFFVGSAGGNYRVTITDACNRTIVQTIRVNSNPLPVAQLVPPAPQICPEGETATITVNFTGVGPFDLVYMLSGDPQEPIYGITDDPFQLTINQIGLYQILSVTDAAGCEGPGQGALLVQPSSLTLTGVTSNAACAGQSNASINTTVIGGQGPYNYNWSGPTTIGNIPDPINLLPGLYLVTVTDGFGCTRSASFNLNVPNALTPTIAGVQVPTCASPFGGSINLEISGGTPNYTYLWSNATNQQDPFNLPAGTYTVTVTDQAGCTRTVTTTLVANNTPPTSVASVDQPLDCQTPTATLSGQGSSVGPNFGYTWSTATGNITGPLNALTTTANQGGVYQLVVTNSNNGCTATSTVTVISDANIPIAEAGPSQQLTCAITNVALNGTGSSSGSNQFEYLWTASNGGTILGGASTLQPIVGSTGTYTLQVTNISNGCSNTDQVIVTENITEPTAVIGAPGQITCTQNTVTLNASGSSPSNVAYSWSTNSGNIINGQSTATPVVNEEGFYTVVVTNPQNGCTADATAYVPQDLAVPMAIATANGQLNCVATQVTINGSSSSTGAGFSYVWTTTNGGPINNPNTLTPSVTQPGLYSLVVTNTANNCTATASVQIDQNTLPPVVTMGAPATINCYTPTAVLGDPSLFVVPGEATYQWTASNGGVILSGNGTPSVTVNQGGTYALVVTNSAIVSNGCANSGTITVAEDQQNPTAVVAPPVELNCTNQFVQLNGQGSSSGPTFSYNWATTNGVISAGQNSLTPAVTAAGTYTLTVLNNVNGCTSTVSANVNANLNVPDAVIAPAPALTCVLTQTQLSGAGSSAGANFQYQWGTVGGQILSGANTLTPTVGLPGTYTLIVTNNNNNCTAVQNVVVPSDAAPPPASAGSPQTLSCNLPTLTLIGSSNTGSNYSYSWSATNGGNIVSGGTTLTPVIDAPGTYVLSVTNSSNGCTSVSGVQIAQDASQPVIQLADPATLTCATAQTTLNSTGSSSGGNYVYTWSGPGIVGNPNATNATVNEPGIYTLEIVNTDNGCTENGEITVPEDVAPPVADAGANAILNCFNPVLALGGSNMSAGANFVYTWSGPGILSGINSASPTIDQPGTYNVVVTNIANGCVSNDEVALTADFAPPSADAGPGGELTCVENFYQTVPVTSTGNNFTYNWSTNTGSFLTPATSQAPILNGEGFYFLTVTNTTNGCTATDQLQITRSAEFPAANAGQSAILTCTVQQLTLDGSNSEQGDNIQYLWIPTVGGNIVSGDSTLFPVIDEPGTYQLVVRDISNSCISYSQVIIAQNLEEPEVEAGQPVTLTCSVNSLDLLAEVSTNGVFTYDWSATGGGNILAGGTTLNPSVNAVGNYIIVVTNTFNGCTSTDAVQVLADLNAPVVDIAQPDTLTCIANEVILDATGSSTGNVAYTWTTTNGNIIEQNDPLQVKVNQPGQYQLLIIDLDNNCTSLAAVQVFENQIVPIAQAGNDYEIDCNNVIETLDGTGSSQNGNYFYAWTTPNGEILVGGNTLTPTVSAAGTYLLTVLNTDNGCSSSDLTIVGENTIAPTITIVIPAVITCFEPEIVLDGTNSSNGPDFSYAWTSPTGNFVGPTDGLQAVVNDAGSYTLTVLNNQNGCSNASTTFVSVNTVPPNVQILPPADLTCDVPAVSINAIGPAGTQYVFGWTTTDGSIVAGNNTLTPLVDEPGTYSILVVNNNNGCATFEDTEVDEITNRPTDFEYTLTVPGCSDLDGRVEFDTIIGGIGPYVYSINGGESFSTQAIFGNLASGAYELLIQDVNGCEWIEPLDVPEAPDPGVELIPEFQLEFGDSLRLEAQLPPGYPIDLIDTVIWKPLDYLRFDGNSIEDLLSPTTLPFHTVRYEVKIISANGGCEATDRVFILVDSDPHIYFPNVIWPEDPDQENALFMIFADDERRQIRQINQFQIFSRWGEMVFQDTNFQPNDPAHGWNGRIGSTSNALTPAVFVYYAEIEMIDGRILFYEGDVTVVR